VCTLHVLTFSSSAACSLSFSCLSAPHSHTHTTFLSFSFLSLTISLYCRRLFFFFFFFFHILVVVAIVPILFLPAVPPSLPPSLLPPFYPSHPHTLLLLSKGSSLPPSHPPSVPPSWPLWRRRRDKPKQLHKQLPLQLLHYKLQHLLPFLRGCCLRRRLRQGSRREFRRCWCGCSRGFKA